MNMIWIHIISEMGHGLSVKLCLVILPPVMYVGLESPLTQLCMGTKGWFIGSGGPVGTWS